MPEGEPSKAYLEVTREKMRSVLYAAVQGIGSKNEKDIDNFDAI